MQLSSNMIPLFSSKNVANCVWTNVKLFCYAGKRLCHSLFTYGQNIFFSQFHTSMGFTSRSSAMDNHIHFVFNVCSPSNMIRSYASKITFSARMSCFVLLSWWRSIYLLTNDSTNISTSKTWSSFTVCSKRPKNTIVSSIKSCFVNKLKRGTFKCSTGKRITVFTPTLIVHVTPVTCTFRVAAIFNRAFSVSHCDLSLVLIGSSSPTTILTQHESLTKAAAMVIPR